MPRKFYSSTQIANLVFLKSFLKKICFLFVCFLKSFWANTCPYLGPLVPFFGFLVASPLGFKARVGSALFTFLWRQI